MNSIEILLLAYALSIDAFVVSFSYGILSLANPVKNRILISLFTGGGQLLMPIAGYYFASLILNYIAPYAKFIVFAIFTFLGIKFIKEAFDKKTDKPVCIGIACLFLLGLATSIDAFSAGVSLLLSKNTIWKPALLIGVVTLINSNIGFLIGEKLRVMPVKYIEILAGLILVIMGINAII